MSEELTWLPAWRIRELIAKKEVSPVEVTDHFLGRIAEHDGVLKTFKTLDEKGAREQAKRAEAAVKSGNELGPLHGIPISFKEHIAVEGMPVMGEVGGGLAKRDALAVERLRDAGAIVFGTNTMMGTGGGGPMSESGHYNWDQEARNPWDPTRVPGWSSSGGASAASARLMPITVGTDGGGSTRLPAAYSGVVGMHPTPAIIPTLSYDAPKPSSLTISLGPLCRDVADAAITLQAMAGPDGRDYTCIQFDQPDYMADLEAGVDGMRLAWTDDYGFTSIYNQPESDRVIAHIRDAAQGLKTLGATLETTDVSWEDFYAGFMASVSLVMRPGSGAPLPEAEAWNRSLDCRQANWLAFRKVFRDHDLLVSPTSMLTAYTAEEWDRAWIDDKARFTHGVFGPGTYTSHTQMHNWLGIPSISVPCGFVDGLPVGLQICGPVGSENRILRAARAFQNAFPQDAHPTVS